MIFVQIDKTTNEIGMVHHMPFDPDHGLGKTQDELLQEGILVDSLPVPEVIEGKNNVLKYSPTVTTNSGLYYDYVDIVKSPEQILKETVVQLQTANQTADQKYKALDLTLAKLDDVKMAKIEQLNEACNNTITSGFDYTVSGTAYHFSCSLTAQQNFTGTKLRMDAGKDTTKTWTATNNTTGKTERIILSVADIDAITDIVDNLVSTNISKFRDVLEPKVEAALANADVDAINW